jgi:hypothetical protein
LVAAFGEADAGAEADGEAEVEADGLPAPAAESGSAPVETVGVALGSTKLGASALCAAVPPQAARARLLTPMTTRFRTLYRKAISSWSGSSPI